MNRQMGKGILDLFTSESSSPEPSAEEQSPFAAPPPPVAKRLNRNALTVAAVIMGMTVIACLVVLRGDSGSKVDRRTASSPSEEVASPTFLERPAQAARPIVFNDDSLRPATVATSNTRQGQSPARGDVGAVELRDYGSTAPEASASSFSTRSPAPRDQAFTAALRHSAIAGSGNESSASTSSSPLTGSSPGLATEESQLVAYGDSLMRSATKPSSAAPMTLTTIRQSFMTRAGDQGGKSALASLQPSAGPYVLRAGTVIPAMLLTAITSDLPGDCMGQVSRDVYDSQAQQLLLIPKGSKLMCRYDDQVVVGQSRLLIAWTRLILPDGRSMTLPGLALKDAQGQTGAKGDVDNHTGRVFGRALLLSAIGAGAQLSQPRQSSILAAPTTGQVMAGAVGQEMSNVALEVLRRGMDQAPTITVPQGATFNVFLNGDLVFDGPYDTSR
ncbi:MAG TPA: TrbI/VirB10 family protein [Gemmatimonadaceae bacterium]